MKLYDYFSGWEGWSCDVEEDGETCGEVIESDEGSMIEHLKNKHGINLKAVGK